MKSPHKSKKIISSPHTSLLLIQHPIHSSFDAFKREITRLDNTSQPTLKFIDFWYPLYRALSQSDCQYMDTRESRFSFERALHNRLFQLGQHFGNTQHITELDLTGCYLRQGSLNALLKGYAQKNSKIRKIILSENFIGSKSFKQKDGPRNSTLGLIHLGQLLTLGLFSSVELTSCHLTTLDICQLLNGLGSSSAHSLKTVNLFKNPLGEDFTLYYSLLSEKCQPLVKRGVLLDFSFNGLPEEKIAQLAPPLTRQAAPSNSIKPKT